MIPEGEVEGRMTDPVLFALTVLTILGTPGPTNTLLAAGGATAGFRRALVLVPAEAAGYLIAISTIGLVLGPFLAAHPSIGLVLRVAVGAYLLMLSLRLWQSGAAAIETGAQAISPRQVFVTTLLNPKAVILALGVIPFDAANRWLYMLGFLLLLLVAGPAWIAAGAGMGRAARSMGWGRLVPRIGAASVAGFAVVLAVSPFVR